MSDGDEVNATVSLASALAAHTLVATAGMDNEAAGTLITWAKQAGDLPVPGKWGAGEMSLVLAYMLKFHEQVGEWVQKLEVERDAQKVLDQGSVQLLRECKLEDRCASIKVVDKLTEVVQVMTGLVDEVQQEQVGMKRAILGLRESVQEVRAEVVESREQRVREQRMAEVTAAGKERETKQGLQTGATTTTTQQRVWESKSGLSLFSAVVKKGVGEDGVAFLEMGPWKANHPSSIKWSDKRNKHEYNRMWELLEKATTKELAESIFTRLAELVTWNEFGWEATKEAFEIKEVRELGVTGPKMEERLEKARKVKEMKEKEKEKEGKGGDKGGSSAKNGSWKEGGEFRRQGFKGQCYNCGMFGHSAKYCREGGNGQRGFRGACYLCGQWGHAARECSFAPPRVPGGMGAGMFFQHNHNRGGWNNNGQHNHGQGQGQQGQQPSGMGFTKGA